MNEQFSSHGITGKVRKAFPGPSPGAMHMRHKAGASSKIRKPKAVLQAFLTTIALAFKLGRFKIEDEKMA